MKALLVGFLTLVSVSAFALETGKCTITAFSDLSADDNTPHQFYTLIVGSDITLTSCLEVLDKSINYLRNCGAIVGSTIHRAEMNFLINNRTVTTVEPLDIRCPR